MADMLRVFGWLMAGGGALAHLIFIILGFTTLDWGPVMVFKTLSLIFNNSILLVNLKTQSKFKGILRFLTAN